MDPHICEERVVIEWAGLIDRVGLNGTSIDEVVRIKELMESDGRSPYAWEHVLFTYNEFFELDCDFVDCDSIFTALLYQHATFNPTTSSNELINAKFAMNSLSQYGASNEFSQRVSNLIILGTYKPEIKTQQLQERILTTIDEKTMFDLNLAYLGLDREELLSIDEDKRNHFSGDLLTVYQFKRHAKLTGLLKRESVFTTPHFKDRYEAKAQENIRMLLDLKL